ncbi:MAG: hypothetical protein A2X39_04885 [Elusimicrobia bacterium GWC2_56_31]|nr:MAG: hypothetical protein A2X39_04885 [Elusimicrobia bacterium GWC2_56_31]HBB67667.1 hypothetical protein [Elusimicrobiota bacterium]HBW22849.1 hypothetical protein [Elusimicrobiota bacterium]
MTAGKTLFLSHVNSARPNDIGNGFLREFIKNGAVFLDYNEIYLKYGHSGSQKFIKDFIIKNGVKILIFAADPTSFHFPPEFFRKLQPHVFTVMMAGDTVYYFEARDKYYAGAMDLFIVYDSSDTVRIFQNLGGDAFLFMGAFDRTRYFKLENREKTIDVSFVGGLAGRKDRMEYVDYLAKNGVNVRVFGFGAPGGQVSQEQMVEIFNKSRINLNFTGANVPNRLAGNIPLPAGRKQAKGRIAEVALCGSFVLSEQAPDIEKMLRPEEEMAVFATKEELLEKTRFYLSNEREREAVAERGYQRAIRDFDVSLAIPKLLSEIEARRKSRKPGPPGISPGATFKKNFASYRMLCIIKFLKQLNFVFALEEFLVILKLGTLDFTQLYTFFIEEVVDKFPKTKTFVKKMILK